MSGFMRGYQFMEGIEDNRRRRERDDYTFDRLKRADVRADKVQVASDINEQIKILRTGGDGQPLTDEQIKSNPAKLDKLKELSNLPIFDGLRNAGLVKGTTSKTEELVLNPNGSVTPVVTQFDNKGVATSTGPATLDRKAAKDDPKSQSIVLQATPTELINKLTSHIAGLVPGAADTEIARRKEVGRRRDLQIVADEATRGQVRARGVAPTAQPTTAPTPTAQPTPEPITPPDSAQAPTTTEPTPAVGSIEERAATAGKKEPASLAGATRAGVKQLEKFGASIFEGGVKRTVGTFATAADPTKSGSAVALDRITGFPKDSGRKLVDNFSRIEKEVGAENAQGLRKSILKSLADKGIDDPELTRELERLEVMSPKMAKDVSKVEKGTPKDPEQFNNLLAKDKNLISDMRPGAKFSKQTGGPSKAYKDALIRLHMANPAAVPIEALERGLRTGRMSKRDIQFIANKNFIAVADKETGTVEIIKQFADPKASADKVKADRLLKADRFKSMERMTDLIYPDKKKQASQRSTFAARMLVSEDTLGFDITDPSVFPMIKTAESMTRGETTGWFADAPNEYPSHTPGIIAQGLGVENLEEAKAVFFRPIQETRHYGGRAIPEREAQKLSTIVAALQIKGVPIEEASALVVGALNKGMTGIFNQDPALLAQGYIQGRR